VATRSSKPVQTSTAFSAANPDLERTHLRVLLAPRSVIYPSIPNSGAMVDEKKHILVKAIVNPEGTVDDVQVPGQAPSLARAIAKTVKQWRYQPYVLNGQPVEVETHMIFTVLGSDAITVRFLPPGESLANE
jgi:outer membrane biosynthesis protein TonB